ncbi:hypothetical protein L596_002915 [Steinernema carpocapsae]|uniref:Aquaporin n=1 Tax=Steinernema carpocapsae TaxID=34508 RepID=A0A4U8UUQ9_STECR|nr:hypothetical protein L596_002915 [Steinernema carpocapsae]
MTTDNAYHRVFFVVLVYHVAVFAVCEIARRFVERTFNPKSLIYFFLMELICTVNTTVGTYENGFLIGVYGLWAIVYIIVSAILTGKYNRGAFGSPLPPFEAFFNGYLSHAKMALLLVAELIAVAIGYPIAQSIWSQTFWALEQHKTGYYSSGCELFFKVPVIYAFLYELVNGFLVRTAFCTPGKLKALVIPTVFVSSIVFCGKYIGSPGISPVLAASLFGCEPLSYFMFFVIYWLAPLIGWMLSSKLLPAPRPEKPKEKSN